MWLNNPQCGHIDGQKFPIFLEGKSSHVQITQNVFFQNMPKVGCNNINGMLGTV